MNVHELYGPSIQDAGWVPSPTYLMRRARILRRISTLQPGSVLEIGCGAGALLFELGRLGFDSTALETSDAARNIAQALHERSGARIVSARLPTGICISITSWPLRFSSISKTTPQHSLSGINGCAQGPRYCCLFLRTGTNGMRAMSGLAIIDVMNAVISFCCCSAVALLLSMSNCTGRRSI